MSEKRDLLSYIVSQKCDLLSDMSQKHDLLSDIVSQKRDRLSDKYVTDGVTMSGECLLVQ